MKPEDKIRKIIETGHVSHAYIFEGDSFSGKELLARSFLASLLKTKNLENCPDFYEVRAGAGQGRSVKSIKDEDLEELQSDLKLRPAGERSAALIYDADSMTVRAQNRFLKTLEEPAPGTVIVMLSENTENLLETVRSRCVIFRFNDLGTAAEGAGSDLIDAVLEKRTFHETKVLLTKEVKSREDAFAFLDALERTYRDILVGRDGRSRFVGKDEGIRAVRSIESARRALLRNAGTAYVLKQMILKIQDGK